jgi:hypothetical protein
VATAAIAGFATMARATPTLTIYDFDVATSTVVDSVTITDNGAGDANSTNGVVEFNGTIDGWDVNTTVGVSSTNPTQLDLSSVDRSTGTGSLFLVFSDTGFTASGNAQASIGGTQNGGAAVNFWSYSGTGINDLSNGLTSQFLSGNPFSGSQTSSTMLGGGGTYSLTEIVEIHNQGVGSITSFDADVAVPDTGTTLLLVALGLAAIGFSARRFRLLAA